MPNYQAVKRLPVIGERGSTRQTIVCGEPRTNRAALVALIVGAVLALAIFVGWLIGSAPR